MCAVLRDLVDSATKMIRCYETVNRKFLPSSPHPGVRRRVHSLDTATVPPRGTSARPRDSSTYTDTAAHGETKTKTHMALYKSVPVSTVSVKGLFPKVNPLLFGFRCRETEKGCPLLTIRRSSSNWSVWWLVLLLMMFRSQRWISKPERKRLE